VTILRANYALFGVLFVTVRQHPVISVIPRSELFTAELLKIKIFRHMTLCQLVNIYRRFGEACFFSPLHDPSSLPVSHRLDAEGTVRKHL